MKMTKILAVAGGVAVLAVAAVAGKPLSPPVKDAYFDPDTDKLRVLPANLVVVRETHFPNNSAKTREIRGSEEDDVTRLLGRNVRLQDVIAAAWDCNRARVVLPAEVPKGGFDFLVTTGEDARERLQAAIRKELELVARPKTRDTAVWVLKIANADLPGLVVSPKDEKPGATEREGRLYLRPLPLSVILGRLSQGLGWPVIDKTGLDGFYNFSVPWTSDVQQRMQDGAFSAEGVQKFLDSLGLRMEPGTEPQEMYVVEKAL